eukprot:TRINITY_DN124891_c0_g1_i1.p1 TRINITY_DN124891_c0_g1~~TRINITY_DN124891_c0_g1_i1.p1  ORF type:complete len:270 (-),score=85.66 TRINITY_DN124891_c0_g1_i1:64-873(-)
MAPREEEKKSKKADKAGKEKSDKRGDGKPKEEFAQWELAPDEFIISVELGEGKILGLDVDWADGRTLYIKGVKPGVVKDWNEKNPAETVNSGDRVIAVNGVADDPDAMLAVVRKRGKLSLLIRGQVDRKLQREKARLLEKLKTSGGNEVPPTADTVAVAPAGVHQFVVSLETGGQTLGLDVDWADGKVLYVRAVQAGAIEDWNRRNASDQWIQPGDTILAVNGVSADPQAMMQQCKGNRKLQLRIQGPPLPPEGDPEEREKKKRKKDKA